MRQQLASKDKFLTKRDSLSENGSGAATNQAPLQSLQRWLFQQNQSVPDIVGISIRMNGENFFNFRRKTNCPSSGFGGVADLSARFHKFNKPSANSTAGCSVPNGISPRRIFQRTSINRWPCSISRIIFGSNGANHSRNARFEQLPIRNQIITGDCRLCRTRLAKSSSFVKTTALCSTA